MKKTAPTAPAGLPPCLRALAALALLFALGHSREARAQWTQPSGSGSIHNTNAGKVGVGTNGAEPGGQLEVVGPSTGNGPTIRAGGGGDVVLAAGGTLFFDGNYSYASGSYIRPPAPNTQSFFTSGVERVRISSAGNVGVGTPSPDQKLGVQGMLGIYPQAWVQPSGRGMYFFHGGTGGSIYAYNYPAGSADPITITAASLTLSTFIGGGGNERLTVTNGGNVGIGTTAPAERLHVEGNLKVTGNIEARYQDVAEWVPSAERLEAGTVVVLDPSRSNHVLASSSAYDTTVAGVVSAQPGIVLGEGGEGKVKVATTGRVRVRVDASKGAIKIGDLLVTGDLPGTAMRSEPVALGGRKMHAPGTIIGKALEPLGKGMGEILVLLSLQ
jgi:hypothetical protein